MLFTAALVFFTVSFFTQLGIRLSFLGAIRHELLLGFVLLVMSFLAIMQTPPRLSGQRFVIGGMVFFILVQAIQVPLAASIPDANYTFTEYVLKQALYCSFIVCLIRSPRQFFFVVGAFIFAMFWIYRETVRGLISGSLVWYNQGVLRLHGAVPRYFHPNGLSLAACMVLPYIFYLLPALRRFSWAALFFLATMVLAGLCIVNTGSRAGYVGLLALIPYWILDGTGRLKRLAIAIMVAGVVLPAIPEQYVGRFESITGDEVEGHSREARTQILIDAWEVFKLHPFGTGLQGFQVVRMAMFGRHQDTHNLYAQIATHLGVQGLAAFTFFILAMFLSQNRAIADLAHARQRLLRMRENNGSQRQAANYYLFEINLMIAIVRAVKMLLYFLLVNGIFAHTLYHVIWYFLAGLTVSAGGIASQMAQRAGTQYTMNRHVKAEEASAPIASAREQSLRRQCAAELP